MHSRLTSNRVIRAIQVVSQTVGLGLTGTLVMQGQTPSAKLSSVKLKVAAVQFRSAFDVHQNCKRMVSFLDRLAAQGVQVAVFPECALTGYYLGAEVPPSADEIAQAEDRLRQTCRERKIAAIFGSVYKVNGHAYDSAVVFDSHGELIERYGKIYLAGEKWATRGNHIAYFDLAGVPSTVIICHDERFPELVRLPATEGARVLYYISAESSLKEESKISPYRAQIMARAVENGMFVVAANAPANHDLTGSHGQSRVVGSDGNVLEEASMFGEDVLCSILIVKTEMTRWPHDALNGPLGDWWRSGVQLMMKDRNRQLN
jgi:predicted amidohydrolase